MTSVKQASRGSNPAAFVFLVFLICLGLLGGLTVATGADDEGVNGAVPASYKFDRQTAVHRASLAAVDSTGSASAASLTEFGALGRVNVPVSARFTAAGETCKVRLYAYWKDGATNYFLGCSSEVTLTASAVQDGTSLYVAPTYVFDSFGAYSVRIVVTQAPTAGSVSLWVGSY